jgi:Skp family chaperone for outer membrane proteins
MRIKTPTLVLVTLAIAALPLGAARAQAKVGVVNVARLLQEAPQAQAADASSRASRRTSRRGKRSSRRTGR